MATKTKAATAAPAARQVLIAPPNLQNVVFKLIGTAPYVQARFSAKAMQAMADKMTKGSQAKKGAARPPRNFQDDYLQAQHISTDGWNGIPAGAFRQAMISACRLVGFKMTLAKLSVFVHGDGIDAIDGIPLVRIEGEHHLHQMTVRNATGVADIRIRPMWREWWVMLTVTYDADQFSHEDVANLLHRVGQQVGIGEGRPDSRASAGLGWGTFRIES